MVPVLRAHSGPGAGAPVPPGCLLHAAFLQEPAPVARVAERRRVARRRVPPESPVDERDGYQSAGR